MLESQQEQEDTDGHNTFRNKKAETVNMPSGAKRHKLSTCISVCIAFQKVSNSNPSSFAYVSISQSLMHLSYIGFGFVRGNSADPAVCQVGGTTEHACWLRFQIPKLVLQDWSFNWNRGCPNDSALKDCESLQLLSGSAAIVNSLAKDTCEKT